MPDIDSETRRLLIRLYDERDNPPALRRNLRVVQAKVHKRLFDQGITTTNDSVTTCLMYMARDGEVGDDGLRQAIFDTVQEIGQSDVATHLAR